MTHQEIFNLFLLVSAMHGFLFCFLILFSKNGREKSMIYMNLLVLSISLNNIQSWILAKKFFIEYFFLDYIHIPWHFVSAPFFYTFLIHYLNIEKESKSILKLALPIFLLLIIIRISFVSFYSDNDSIEVTYLFEKYTTFEEIFSLVVSLTTFGYSFHIVSKRQDLFSQILSYDNLKWVYSFFKLGVSIYIFWIVALAFTVVLDFKDFIYSYYPLRVLTTVLIYWAGYQSILQLRLLKERKNLRKKLNLQSVTTQTFDTNTSDNSEYLDALFAKLEKLLESTRLFTQPKINLELLANELDVSSNKLSSCIKKNTSNNFNDFINGYRVHLAKELLVDNDYKQYTITSIGLESGFNSKSSFYYTFKKYTGITPAAYQKSIKL